MTDATATDVSDGGTEDGLEELDASQLLVRGDREERAEDESGGNGVQHVFAAVDEAFGEVVARQHLLVLMDPDIALVRARRVVAVQAVTEQPEERLVEERDEDDRRRQQERCGKQTLFDAVLSVAYRLGRLGCTLRLCRGGLTDRFGDAHGASRVARSHHLIRSLEMGSNSSTCSAVVPRPITWPGSTDDVLPVMRMTTRCPSTSRFTRLS